VDIRTVIREGFLHGKLSSRWMTSGKTFSTTWKRIVGCWRMRHLDSMRSFLLTLRINSLPPG
jgi:hypothetical protein